MPRIDFSNLKVAYDEITKWHERDKLKRQQDHHEQILVEFNERKAFVDKGISKTVINLWALGIETAGSCQGTQSGKNDYFIHLPRKIDVLNIFEIILSFQPDIRSKEEFEMYFLKCGIHIDYHNVDCPCPFDKIIYFCVSDEFVWLFEGIINEAADQHRSSK